MSSIHLHQYPFLLKLKQCLYSVLYLSTLLVVLLFCLCCCCLFFKSRLSVLDVFDVESVTSILNYAYIDI